jgi:riboflavin kinase/FMN adenylyltransferase
MIVLCGIDSIKRTWPSSIACIGTFDGVHLGHQALLKSAAKWAAKESVPSIALTFDRHPAAVLAPQHLPAHIAPIDECMRAFQQCGISMSIVLPFTKDFSRQTADEFLQEVLVARLGAKGVAVGHDFAFGKDRQGTGDWLSARIETRVLGEVMVDGVRVSSTTVRNLISAGDVAGAGRILGRPWVYSGFVVHGKQLGRTLGFPTLNLVSPANQMVPADGVYAGWAVVEGARFRAAISVGMRPTFAGENRTVEAYLVDYPGDMVYGRHVRLAFLERIRAELKFNSAEELVQQMHVDVEQCRTLVTENHI